MSEGKDINPSVANANGIVLSVEQAPYWETNPDGDIVYVNDEGKALKTGDKGYKAVPSVHRQYVLEVGRVLDRGEE